VFVSELSPKSSSSSAYAAIGFVENIPVVNAAAIMTEAITNVLFIANKTIPNAVQSFHSKG
jgi:hypothetical protein